MHMTPGVLPSRRVAVSPQRVERSPASLPLPFPSTEAPPSSTSSSPGAPGLPGSDRPCCCSPRSSASTTCRRRARPHLHRRRPLPTLASPPAPPACSRPRPAPAPPGVREGKDGDIGVPQQLLASVHLAAWWLCAATRSRRIRCLQPCLLPLPRPRVTLLPQPLHHCVLNTKNLRRMV